MSALLVQGAAALAIVAGLAYARRQLRRGADDARTGGLEIRQRRPLGRESGVAIVCWNGREVLVGYGSSGVSTLASSTEAPREEVRP